MAVSSCSRHALRSLQPSCSHFTVPLFLLPACHASARTFTTTRARESKIGAIPLSVPPEVDFGIAGPSPSPTHAAAPTSGKQSLPALARGRPPTEVSVKGPLGELSYSIPPYLYFDLSAPGRASLKCEALARAQKKGRAMWGMTRQSLNNCIIGVSEGHTAVLSLVGVGYRATVEKGAQTKQPEYEGQQFVSLKVGYSHPIELGVPKGVKASCPQPTRILLEGCDKEVVMQFAAEIREWRKPEPYKGKGIFVNGETIKLKNKKIK